ncbi:MAG: diguanylate cyclase [Thermodesulfobacteriota bacterium]|nr:diguanylate cyclase [Thermodesulfobacteriota bacterium]
MVSPPHVVNINTTFNDAAEIMKEKNIRRLIVLDHDGKIAGLITLSDIIKGLERKFIETLSQVINEKDVGLQSALEKLAQKTLYLNNILSSSIDMGIAATDVNFRILYFNSEAENILGHRAEDVLGRDAREILHKENVDISRFNRVVGVVRKNLGHTFSFERIRNNESRYIKARMSGIWDQTKNLEGFVLMLRDVTARKKAEETIHYLAYHDPLTDLPNRLLFNQRLDLELARAERNNLKLALVLIDLDRFKEVNDTLGHHVGDALLQSAAKRLKSRIRKCDTVARIGGDEFTLILPEIHAPDDALHAAEKIIKALEQPYMIEGHKLYVSASIGISIYPVHGTESETLLKTSDKAMYKAKEQRLSAPHGNVRLYQEEESEIPRQ